MSSSILEQIRVNHEVSELYESAICKELDVKPVGVSFLQACWRLFGQHAILMINTNIVTIFTYRSKKQKPISSIKYRIC